MNLKYLLEHVIHLQRVRISLITECLCTEPERWRIACSCWCFFLFFFYVNRSVIREKEELRVAEWDITQLKPDLTASFTSMPPPPLSLVPSQHPTCFRVHSNPTHIILSPSFIMVVSITTEKQCKIQALCLQHWRTTAWHHFYTCCAIQGKSYRKFKLNIWNSSWQSIYWQCVCL